MVEYYRVEKENEGCKHCGHGDYWTIVSGTGDDEVGISTSWGDRELADDICDLMNDAYAAGQEDSNPALNAEEAKLVEFFCSADGNCIGRDGDYDNLSPAETAIRFMRKHLIAEVAQS